VVHMRGVGRLVLAAQPVGDDRGEAADDETLGVDQHPLLLHLGRLLRVGLHGSSVRGPSPPLVVGEGVSCCLGFALVRAKRKPRPEGRWSCALIGEGGWPVKPKLTARSGTGAEISIPYMWRYHFTAT